VVSGIVFAGVHTAEPSPEVIGSLDEADAVILAPSNPFLSIEPILALPSIRERIARKPAIAVSPIVGGQAIKGPAAKMLSELGLHVSATGVASRYRDLIRGFVIDEVDAGLKNAVEALGLRVRLAQSIMRTDQDREQLARVCLDFVSEVEPVP
jgi:LPPG:FO 2-phospho-L-lactate transferase